VLRDPTNVKAELPPIIRAGAAGVQVEPDPVETARLGDR
jgi:hypothetical protein